MGLNPVIGARAPGSLLGALPAHPRAHPGLLLRRVCLQVSALRQELRRRDLGQVSVGSFEILPGGCWVLG